MKRTRLTFRHVSPSIREALKSGAKMTAPPSVSNIPLGRGRHLKVVNIELAAFLLGCSVLELFRMAEAGECRMIFYKDCSLHVDYGPIFRRIFEVGRRGVNSGLSTGQAAQIIKCELGKEPSRQTIVRLIEEGKLKGWRVRGRWVIDRTSMKTYVAAIREEFGIDCF